MDRPDRDGSPDARPRSPRGRYAKSADRREQILTAAAAAFSESGYAGASIRAIADQIGISHATITFHFPTKKELLTAILERQEAAHREPLDAAPGAPLDYLAAIVRVFKLRRSAPGRSELFLMLAVEAWPADHPAHSYLAWRYSRLREGLSAVFLALDDSRLLRSRVDPAAVARDCIALMDGLQLQWFYAPDEVDVSGDMRRFFFDRLNASGRRRLADLLD